MTYFGNMLCGLCYDAIRSCMQAHIFLPVCVHSPVPVMYAYQDPCLTLHSRFIVSGERQE